MDSDPIEKKPRGRAFPKGVSGNPGGRPREAREVVEALRLEGELFVTTLTQLVEERNVEALKLAMAYAYGKPSQEIALAGTVAIGPRFDLSQLSDDEAEVFRALLVKVQPQSILEHARPTPESAVRIFKILADAGALPVGVPADDEPADETQN